MNNYQRVKNKLAEEHAADEPVKQPEDTSPIAGFGELFEGLTREQAEQLVEEYTSADGLRNFIQTKKEVAKKNQTEDNQAALKQEYEAELEKTSKPYQVMALKRKFRLRGLNIH